LILNLEPKNGIQGGEGFVLKILLALRNRKANRGFTLIELLVVVAIIGLLAAFAVPKLFEAINKSKGAQGAADAKTIAAALERYYFDKDQYPVVTTLAALKTELSPYLKNSVKMLNGYGMWYYYGTNATGKGYVLVDYRDTSAAVTLTCKDTSGANLSINVPAPTKTNDTGSNAPGTANNLDPTANLSTCVDSATSSQVSVETN
jgi:type II secretion system protein G